MMRTNERRSCHGINVAVCGVKSYSFFNFLLRHSLIQNPYIQRENELSDLLKESENTIVVVDWCEKKIRGLEIG